MKVSLFDFQEDALDDLRSKLVTAHSQASINSPQAASFSAPTGAGKTIIMTALFESIFIGESGFDAQPNQVLIDGAWRCGFASCNSWAWIYTRM